LSHKFKEGNLVTQIMGIRRNGFVIRYIPLSAYTDGSFRAPHSNEMKEIVYVRWADGTQGWTYDRMLMSTPKLCRVK